jgi:predicted aspartyl protease/Flp pilus assembly protein TadD
MRLSLRAVLVVLALVAVLPLFGVRVFTEETPSDAAEVRLQLADLMFGDGRFADALELYDSARTTADVRLRRRALGGAVTSALRIAEYARAFDEAADLIALSPRDADSVALYADTLYSLGRFQESEKRFDDALVLNPQSARARHGRARGLASRGLLEDALDEAQAALRLAPRDAEIHHTVGSIYERMLRYEEAANAYGDFVNLLPNKDRSPKAAWSRSEIDFLRSFGDKAPLEVPNEDVHQIHVVPFRIVNGKVVVKVRVNGGSLTDFTLDTGSERTVITQDRARRWHVKPLSATLSAGVGSIMVRSLQVGRIDSLKIGTLELRNVPSLIKNPPLRDLPTRETESFSPVSLGFSMVVDYGRRELIMARQLPKEPSDFSLPLRVHRLAMVQGTVDGGAANFVVDTGGEVISISTDMASTLTQDPAVRRIPLKVYGTSGWDRDAFLLPGVDLKFQNIAYSNFPVVVLNLRAPSVLLGFQLGGIVGHKFLSPYRVAIDLKASEIRMKALPSVAQTTN